MSPFEDLVPQATWLSLLSTASCKSWKNRQNNDNDNKNQNSTTANTACSHTGQEKLNKSSVLIVGAGGLGCPCAMYLAGAGVGKLAVIDADTVATSNLHRQIAHNEHRVGEAKTESLKSTCAALNSNMQIQTHCERLTAANAAALCAAHDVVIDCSDNPATRYLVNDACVATGVPLVSGAAVGTDGQLSVYGYKGGPCYRCVYPECPAPGNCSSCEEAGVLGPVPGVIGTLQALECIKILSDVGSPLSQSLLLFDALSARFTTVKLRGRRDCCAACSTSAELKRPGAIAAYDYAAFTGSKPKSPNVDAGKGANGGIGRTTDGGSTSTNDGGAINEVNPRAGNAPQNGATPNMNGGIATSSGDRSVPSVKAENVPETSPPTVPGFQPGPLRVSPADLQRMLAATESMVAASQDQESEQHKDKKAPLRAPMGGTKNTENGGGGANGVENGGPSTTGVQPPGQGGVVLVDVRPAELYAATRMHGAMHVGMREVEKRVEEVERAQRHQGDHTPVVVMCRRGNDSQLAAARMRAAGVKNVVDLVGGLHAWADSVDPNMPKL